MHDSHTPTPVLEPHCSQRLSCQALVRDLTWVVITLTLSDTVSPPLWGQKRLDSRLQSLDKLRKTHGGALGKSGKRLIQARTFLVSFPKVFLLNSVQG